MNSASTQFISSRRMSMYDPTPMHQINTWDEDFKSLGNINMSASMIVEVDSKLDIQTEDTSLGTQVHSKHTAKVLRRLAQNREAARKSRLRKKAYVQQLESSRLKLVLLEQELQRARQQSQYIGGGLEANHTRFSGPVNPVISTFELEYGIWVEEQNRQIHELKKALNTSLSNAQLSMLVHNGMRHYSELFCMKANAARADVIYLMSGMWKTPAERVFSWMGGFRPSELLKVLMPQLEPLSEQQVLDVCSLKQSCQQAEDALSQGMEKLQQTLAETIAAGELIEGIDFPQIDIAMDKLEALVSFVTQADHLWQETLQQMDRILTIYQSARGLLALGEYFQRLRALSSLWATRPCEPA